MERPEITHKEPSMFPLDEKPGRRRLTAAAWRVLLDSYRTHCPTALPEQSLPARLSRASESWQTLDVGPWAKGAFAAAFLSLLIFPAMFPLTFPVGALLALVLGISHVNRRLDEQPVWSTPAAGKGLMPRSPFDDWIHEGRTIHRAVEAALVRLPRGMRRTFWPLTQQSEELVVSLERLALRAQQMDDYLNSAEAEVMRKRVTELRALYEGAHDPVVREHLRQADLSLQSALRDQEEMGVHLDRIKAQAAHVNATLQQVLAQLVKQRFTSPEGAWRDYHAAAERLKSLRYQIDAVEQVTSSHLLDQD
jgi:hypothetical protein